MTVPGTESETLPSPWWADSDGEANWLRRHDANNQDEMFWCDDAGADYLNVLEEAAKELDFLVDEMPACELDEARDYCMTHHAKHCTVAAHVARAREVLEGRHA